MPASAAITKAASIDRDASILTPYFAQRTDDGKATLRTGSYWYVPRLRLQLGLAPSYCVCSIPLKDLDDVAPAVSCVSGSPLDGIKVGTPMAVRLYQSGKSICVFIGFVQRVSASLDSDRALIHCVDYRWLLDAVPIVGSLWTSASSYSHRQAWPGIANEDAMPNMLWSHIGSMWIPSFCPQNYGLADGEAPPDPFAPASDALKASHWTSTHMLGYLRSIVSSAYFDTLLEGSFPWMAHIQDAEAGTGAISWPDGWENALQESTGDYRKARNFELSGPSALRLIVNILQGAGDFDFGLSIGEAKQSDGSTVMKVMPQIVNTRFAEGRDFPRPVSGNALDYLVPGTIIGGDYEEDGRDLYTRVAISAEAPTLIEQRIESANSTTVNDGNLKWAWSSADITAAKTLYNSRRNVSGDSLELARLGMFATFPNLFGYYHVSETYDFQENTTESAFPYSRIGRPILAHMLSSYLEESGGTDYYDKARYRREIRLEFHNGSAWEVVPVHDGLKIYKDGTIDLTGLRDHPLHYTFGFSEVAAPPNVNLSITPRRLRLSLVIPCDHAIVSSVKLACDDTEGGAEVGPDNDDSDRIAKGFQRLYFARTNIYAKEIRRGGGADARGSYAAKPEAVGGTVMAAATLRNDSLPLLAHAGKQMESKGRLSRGGKLVMRGLCMLQPGFQVRQLKNSNGQSFNIRSVVSAVEMINSESEQITVLEFKR